MRLKLTLNHSPNQVLPINYQYLVSSWIYHTLGNADQAFAKKLHDNGYDFRGKKYKLFTFGPLIPKWYQVDKKRATITLSKSPTTIELSFFIDDALQHFVIGLFKDQQFQLTSGRFKADFEVSGIEMLPAPTFENTMRFQLVTPLCVSKNIADKKHAHYTSPDEDGYVELLLRNLLRKQNALTPQLVGESADALALDFPYDFKLLSKPYSKLFTVKGIELRGYLFDFEITATKELLELGYFAGFGDKNSSGGMGMVIVLK